MPAILDYILKLNICLAIVYLFYQIFLRRLTFYNWNRWYLFGYTLVSFIMPLIDVMPSLQKQNLQESSVIQWIPVLNFAAPKNQSLIETLSVWDWFLVGLIFGSLLLLVRMCIRFYAFQKMKSTATLISTEQTKIYQLDADISPFSFGNAIFINTDLHESEDLEEIIRHEFVHVKQKHTVDIIWCELLCILNWFNPFVWLLRHNVRQNLEFIADNKVVQNGFDKTEYQYLLLKVMGNRQFTFTNHFNFSSLKKRIAMMNSVKTAKVHLIKFMFLLPVIAVLLLSFRKEILKKETKNSNLVYKNESINTLSNQKEKDSGNRIKSMTINNTLDTTPMIKPQEKKVIMLNQSKGPKPLIIVDGIELGANEDLNDISPNDIASIEVYKDDKAINSYGEKGKNGVVFITTKASTTNNASNSISKIISNEDVLYVLDGKIASSYIINNMPPDQIESISVLKDKMAIEKYGEKGKSGVVEITSKKPGFKKTIVNYDKLKSNFDYKSNAVRVITFTDTFYVGNKQVENANKESKPIVTSQLKGKVQGLQISAENEPQKTITVEGSPVNKIEKIIIQEVVVTGYSTKDAFIKNKENLSSDTYFVLNGKPVSKSKIEKLKGEEIKSVNKLNESEAQKFYGKKAKHGAIIITTH